MLENEFKLIPFYIDEDIDISSSVNNGIELQRLYGINMINAISLWNKGYTGKNTTIAVLDTGCDTNHPLIKDSIIGGRNFTKDDNNNPNIYEDYQGHGTHVAGTISGRNGLGVAPDAKLLILKVLDKDGNGSFKGIVEAIEYAINKKVDIISMSLGGPNDIPELKNIIIKAIQNDICVVCAAGNRGDNKNPNTHEYDYPGAYEEVIEVGAIDKNKVAARFTNSNQYIDLVAPGVSIYSTYINDGYKSLSGTSMATPHVSGALALIKEWSRKEFNRNLTESEMYAQLIKNTKSLDMSRNLQGNGYLYIDL